MVFKSERLSSLEIMLYGDAAFRVGAAPDTQYLEACSPRHQFDGWGTPEGGYRSPRRYRFTVRRAVPWLMPISRRESSIGGGRRPFRCNAAAIRRSIPYVIAANPGTAVTTAAAVVALGATLVAVGLVEHGSPRASPVDNAWAQTGLGLAALGVLLALAVLVVLVVRHT